jgi:predicted GIY-YIG superfamily endonuclease
VIAIYKLIDPRTNQVKYVGRTKNPTTRLSSHINGGHLGWVRELKGLGFTPIMECIEWVEEDDASDREMFWINSLRTGGCNLVNYQPLPDTPTASLKISADLHRRVKIHAVQNGYRLQDFIERVIEKSLNRKKP